jgi:transcription elongation GreA/GreB family factor
VVKKMTLKQKIKSHYIQLLEAKILTLQNQITDLTTDAQNDAKGSAGDKHETALAMMHLEQEKRNQKLTEISNQKNILEVIDSSVSHKVIALGSLVKANEIYFFIATALPQIPLDGATVFGVSPEAPIGVQFMEKKAGDSIQVNTITYKIESVF